MNASIPLLGLTLRSAAHAAGVLVLTTMIWSVGGSGSVAAAAETMVVEGETVSKAETRVVTSPTAIFSLDVAARMSFRARTRIRLAPASDRTALTALLVVGPGPGESLGDEAVARVGILRSSGEHDGRLIRFQLQRRDDATGKWGAAGDPRLLLFWPLDKKIAATLTADGVELRSWHDHWINLRIDCGERSLTVWADGVLVASVSRTAGDLAASEAAVRSVLLQLSTGDAIEPWTVEAWEEDRRFLPLDLREVFNAEADHAIVATVPADDVPFDRPAESREYLDLRDARWIDQRRDPQTFYEAYDGGPSFANDPRMPVVSVPKADYVAAHLLAAADTDRQTTADLTLRVGRYGYMKQVFQRDFAAAIPRADREAGFTHVRVPLTQTLAQDVLDDVIEIELTKELRLARHVPDPNRFRIRPLGLPSGVRIAAITLERSPLQMKVVSDEPAHAFVEPMRPTFKVQLSNITTQVQRYTLVLEARHLKGGVTSVERHGDVSAMGAVEVTFPVVPVRRGYHDLTITLRDATGETLLTRTTSFAQLPPDTRAHRDTSPFGTWEWNGTHVTPTDSDAIGSLFKKLGLRYGMSQHSPDARKKWGLLVATEPRLEPELKQLTKLYAKDPTMPLRGLVFHEDSISGPHVMRIPDLFHDRPAYKLNEEEEARYQTLLTKATGGAKAAREKFPGIAISFGNGPMTTKEEFYRRGFPSELFDAGGNESGSFHRLPEAQPPDGIGNNAGLWMDRQMLDAYGYADKAVHQCLEVGYPNDNPGNHSATTQADYFARNALHSLAWGMDFLHIGEITDVGNSYYFSNWGAAGFCRAYPEMNVKPAFVSLATLTLVLDGATFEKVWDAGSPSVYAVEFRRADGKRVLAVWTIRGERDVKATHTGDGEWVVVDDQGNESPATGTIVATASPAYLVGAGDITSVTAGRARYTDAAPAGAVVVAPLESLEGWVLETARNTELETYNFLEPRRKGEFVFDSSTVEGHAALRITPMPITHGKDTMPMYARLTRESDIPIPGTPDEIGIWINGNSGWGRVIFELRDAGGQRWVSLGAAASGEAPQWLTDWMPLEMQGQLNSAAPATCDWSTNDAYGLSRINFDGWRYVAFPLPGNYPGESHPWPVNCNWRWDGDGVVRYPLRLTGITVELPEKVLHVKSWSPVPNTAIEVRDITVGRRGDWDQPLVVPVPDSHAR